MELLKNQRLKDEKTSPRLFSKEDGIRNFHM
jgi:hypothetical protein